MRSLNERSFEAIRYWGCGLNRISQDDGVVWTSLEQADRDKSGYHGFDDADLINIMSTVEDAQVAVIFVDQLGGKVKVSWRSKSGINVSNLAEGFGGGGHDAAAGAMIKGDLDQVIQSVLEATLKMVKGRVETKE
jgi:phosphoesterase RecJ-like protein